LPPIDARRISDASKAIITPGPGNIPGHAEDCWCSGCR
jgi:hypothetical protein